MSCSEQVRYPMDRTTTSDSLLAEQFVICNPTSSTAESSSSQEVGKGAAKAAAKAKQRVGANGQVLVPKGKAKAKPKRFYVIVSGPDHLLGVWHAQWAQVAAALPTGKLFGSGCRLLGFDSREDARSKWFETWESDPPEHSP